MTIKGITFPPESAGRYRTANETQMPERQDPAWEWPQAVHECREPEQITRRFWPPTRIYPGI
jgi:hypothetical protein